MNEDQFGAQHVASRLMRESLMDKTLIARTEAPVRAILPMLNVLQIGGLSHANFDELSRCPRDPIGLPHACQQAGRHAARITISGEREDTDVCRERSYPRRQDLGQ